MQPIQNKDQITHNGNRLKTLTLDPFAFNLNSVAMGDVIAAVPVIKHMVENYYTTPESYRVIAKQYFRPLFPFVPDSNFVDFDNKASPNWGLPTEFIHGLLNKKREVGITRNTPKHMKLGVFASVVLADRVLPESELNYVPLDQVDVSHLGDFSKSVVLVTTYRDVTRMWRPDYILIVAKWLQSRGYQPVFVGKTDDKTGRESVVPKDSLPSDVSAYGLDLRNKTSIAELASVMGQSLAVCGLDSGPIHLAGTTDTPIVCGYTSVSPEHRIPIRRAGKTYAIAPEIECIGCESRWRSNTWNYENCYFGHVNCCAEMKPERFINVLDAILPRN